VAAARAARDAGAALLVSFVCDREARLLSGEPLAEALDAVAPLGPEAIGVNCLPPDAVGACLRVLERSPRPFLVYANLTGPLPAHPEHTTPAAFAAEALGWVAAGAACVGGCCGTTPAHLRALVARLRERPGAAIRAAQ
jgi:homocysteine S-methyltransferase